MKRKSEEKCALVNEKFTKCWYSIHNILNAESCVDFKQFTEVYFEKKPLLLRKVGRFASAKTFSKMELMEIVKDRQLETNKHMTVCRFKDGVKQVAEMEEMASVEEIEAHVKDGFSVQFYQPQRYSDELYEMMVSFESEFGCLAGSSAYLTPPNAQALAPHHDDVEMEGSKKWKVYEPIMKLPAEHSGDLDERDIGTPMMEMTLEEGDMLYLPRGYIHQALATDRFSTHVTISVYQYNTWGNFMEVAIPRMLRRSFMNQVEFRSGLPVNYLEYMGTFPQKNHIQTEKANAFSDNMRVLLKKLYNEMDQDDLHGAADDAAVDFVTNRLPPAINNTNQELNLESARIRLYNRQYLRIVIEVEQGTINVFYSTENSRLDHMGGPAHSALTEENENMQEDDEDSIDEGSDGDNPDSEMEDVNDESPGPCIMLPIQLLPVFNELIQHHEFTSANDISVKTGVELAQVTLVLGHLDGMKLLEEKVQS